MKAVLTAAFAAVALWAQAADPLVVEFPIYNFGVNPATNRSVVVTPIILTPATNQVAVYDRVRYTTGTNGVFWVTNMMVGVYRVAVQAPPDTTSFAIAVTTNDVGSVFADRMMVAMPTVVTRPQDYPYSAQASDARYAVAGGGGLSFIPQVGSESLTNWSALTPSSYSNLLYESIAGTTAGTFSPWTNDVSAGGFSLSNAVSVSATNFYGDGSGLTNLNGYWVQNTVPRSSYASYASTANSLVDPVRQEGVLDALSTTNLTIASGAVIYGDGSGLTNLNAASVVAGVTISNLLMYGTPTSIAGASSNLMPAGSITISKAAGPSLSFIQSGIGASVETNATLTLGNAGLEVTGPLLVTEGIRATSGVFDGDGSSLTNLNASALASGTVPLGVLSGITSNELAESTIGTNKLDETAFLLLMQTGTGSGIGTNAAALWVGDIVVSNTATFSNLIVGTLTLSNKMVGSNVIADYTISSNQLDAGTWAAATNTTPGWKLTEPDYVGGTNTFEPVYTKTQGTNIYIVGVSNSAADGLYAWLSETTVGTVTTTVWSNAGVGTVTKTYDDNTLAEIYTFHNLSAQTNFDAIYDGPDFGAVAAGLSGGLIGSAVWNWTTNYTFGGWGVNGQTPTDGAVLAFGDGLDYTTNGSIWTIFSTNIPAPSLGTTNPPAADKVLTLDSNTNLYWATPAAGGGEVTIGTNTIPTDKHFVLLGETSTNEPNLIVSWQSDAPVMASGGFAGKGLLLTDLNASELSSGTVPLARLGTNTPTAGQVLTAVDGATEWADASGGVTLEQVAAGGFLNVTNSEVILNSDTYAAWSTNGAITLTAETNNLGIVLSNGFAGASFQNYGPGLFDVAWTLDGTNWATGITNVSVTVGMIKGMTEPGNSDPAGVTNLTLLSWTEPSLFGKTNFTRSQILIVDRPKLADAAAPLRTVTNEAWRAVRNQTNWASIPAKSEVDLGGYGERLTAEWKRTATATTNADSLDWLWTGTNVWSVVGPPSVSVSRAEYSVVVSSLTNVLVTLPAAYTSSVPRVLFSHTAKSPAWSRLSSTATATNDTLEVAFTVPNADYGFFRIAIDDGTPSFGTLNGVLELTPRTIAATNSTTWGRGSGLVCVDGDYVYISVGTNAWKRATLEAW